MRTLSTVFLFSIGSISIASAWSGVPDTTRKIWEKGLDQVKMQTAKNIYFSGDLYGALAAYEEIWQDNRGSALVNFRLGEVNYDLKNYSLSVGYFEKAVRVNPKCHKELYLKYGMCMHRLGELDKAEQYYNEYIKVLDAMKIKIGDEYKVGMSQAKRYLEQLAFAKEQIAHPCQVTITNLGDNINTEYDEYGPAVSTDGQTLIFTSRRPDTEGGMKDPYDFKWLEDIYISSWDSETKQWSEATPIEGRLNTDGHDGCLSISPDGTQIFIYRNFGENGSGQIFVSRLTSSGKWSGAKDIGKPINSSFFESSACVTSDGTLYFVSERKGSLGQSDIWMAKKIGKREYGEPVNLGPVINTTEDEKMVFVTADGQLMFIASNGHMSMGGYDLLVSHNIGGKWSKPQNLGYPINTVLDDVNFSVTGDLKKAYYAGFKENGLGESDLYEIDLSKYIMPIPAQ